MILQVESPIRYSIRQTHSKAAKSSLKQKMTLYYIITQMIIQKRDETVVWALGLI